jgi:hypothetical protein
VYAAVHELDEPTEEQLRALFDSMDLDGGGEVSEEEVEKGVSVMWPFVDLDLVKTAFQAADME